ncbi:MAG: hypothetical protein IPL89_11405 [Acidobacteria bacterium]|nr:hypothetical protein [Acidobacteriota bacterium]
MVEPSVASAWRILATGVPPRVAGNLVRAAVGEAEPVPGFVDVDAFGESEWERLRREPGDVFLVWEDGSAAGGIERVQAIHLKQPGAPIVARVPEDRPDLVAGMLRAGVLEIFTEAGHFREALDRARARPRLRTARARTCRSGSWRMSRTTASRASSRTSSTGSTSSASPRTAS